MFLNLPDDNSMIHVDDIRAKLKEVFGFDQFRGNQERIIMNILAGENTFVIMPTGAGKSMCYQMPAVCRKVLPLLFPLSSL